MNFWILNITLAFILSAYLAGIVIPKILQIAFEKKLFDVPNERKIHTALVPCLGGLAFKPVIFFTLALLTGINMSFDNMSILEAAAEEELSLFYGFCAVMFLYLIGIGDDLVGVRYRAKFAVQLICSIMIIAGGIYINDFQGFLGFHELSVWFSYPFTVLLIVFIINAINLIDGIDGLASGLCSVALLFYGLTFYFIHEYAYSMLSFATLGVLVPFFYFNVFGDAAKQKKIFMGDTGSLTIGMIVCFLSIKLSMCSLQAENTVPNPLILAFSPLLIPCMDVVRVYFRRIRHGKSPFLPDKSHIHHKMLAAGFTQRKAMVLIITVAILWTLANIFLSYIMNITFILALDLCLWSFTNMWLTHKIRN